MDERQSSLTSRPAPEFEARAVAPDGTFQTLKLSDYRGKYVVLFFYPLDFTFVCPTEIISFSNAAPEFEKLGVQLLACSVDSVYTHFAWISTPREDGGVGSVRFPLISDITKQISNAYGVLLQESGVALRGLFLIDKNGVVQHEVVNNLPLGRSVQETLRMARALQFFEKNGEVCPADWHEGDVGLKDDPEDSKTYFRQRYGK